MTRSNLLAIAILAEGALGLAGLAWIRLRGLPLAAGRPALAIPAGLATAVLFGFFFVGLLAKGPDLPPVRALRTLYRTVLRPAFGSIGLVELIAISMAAGIGEEVFFRGAVQQELGVLGASVLFGAAHVGGRDMTVLGGWALLTGLVLGALAEATGGLLAPIVAHAVYDAFALAWIRWGPPVPGPPRPC